MNLDSVLKSFSVGNLKRFSFPEIIAVPRSCAHFEKVARDPEDLTHRIDRVLDTIARAEVHTLNRSDVRFIISTIGHSNKIREGEVKVLLDEVERRNERGLFRATFQALLAAFRDFILRPLIANFVKRHAMVLPSEIRKFIAKSGILQHPDESLKKLAGQLVVATDLNAQCISFGIMSRILVSNYGTALKLETIKEAVRSKDAEALTNILRWAFAAVNGTPIADYYEAMLSPFGVVTPLADVQKVIVRTVVERFGDPRINIWPNLTGADAEARRENCLSVIKKWLSIEYLDLFIKIIEETAVDRQFKPRKAFWLGYFEANKISDVTLILASDADKFAKRARSKSDGSEYMKWAKLSQSLSDQSVLLMRIGDLVIAEWSHNGAVRFWSVDDNSAPKFHRLEYVGSSLRTDGLKIQVGRSKKESLRHHENGQWMISARNMIYRHTGVRV